MNVGFNLPNCNQLQNAISKPYTAGISNIVLFFYRKVWAEAREEFFSTGTNHHSLHIIESVSFGK